MIKNLVPTGMSLLGSCPPLSYLCKFMDTDWEPYLRQCSSTDAKWLLFKNRLAEGIEKFVPKISNFYEWRKPSWKCPLLGM